MSALLARLLGLDALQLGDPSVSLGFERDLPAWAWAGVAGAAGVLAVLSYRRLMGPAWARGALAALRAALLLTLAALVAGPRLVETHETSEKDWVVALVDRSASLTVEDAGASAGRAGRAREAALREALATTAPMWSAIASSRELVWLGFDAGAYDLAPTSAPSTGATSAPGVVPALGEPAGGRTAIGRALEQTLRKAAARPLSAVVLFSDGRSADEASRAILRRFAAEHVPVHVVPLGSAEPVGDLAVRRVDGPGVAYVRDAAPVTVEIDRAGGETSEGGSARVRLIDAGTGLTLTEREVEFAPGATSATATLVHTPDDAGRRRWIVEVEPAGADLIAGNNRAEVAVELVDRPLRALYVDGYPRWEQRYLKNVLIREQSVVSSNLLLAPERRYTQEGDEEVGSLPTSPEEWAAYDVVILGDVDPGVFTEEQLAGLRDHVAMRGAGLLWIAGPSATPNKWFDTPLADLLPMSSAGGATVAAGEPVVVSPAPASERLGVLRLGDDAEGRWPVELSDPDSGWSALRWSQRIEPGALKPAVEVLATASAARDPGGERWPLVLSMRFGAGRSLYVATDEIWRWRYGRGERLPERFWVQLLRLMGREALARSGRPALLTLTPGRATVDQPVRIDLELLDQAIIEEGRGTIAVALERAPLPDDDGPPPRVETILRPEAGATRAGMGATKANRFAGVWAPNEAGKWTARVIEPGLGALQLSAEVEVALPDDEFRRPEADHGLLVRIAAETGGRVFEPGELSSLPDFLPNREVRLMHERKRTLWDTPLALFLVVFLLTAEWIGRRVIRLI